MEFILRDSIYDKNLIAVSDDCYRANMALLRYLTSRKIHVCVLKYTAFDRTRMFDIADDCYVIIGKPDRFRSWLKDATRKSGNEPVLKYADSLEDEAVYAWARDYMSRELWTYNEAHDYNRDFGVRRIYRTGLRHFNAASGTQTDAAEYAALRKAAYISADVIREEEVDLP